MPVIKPRHPLFFILLSLGLVACTPKRTIVPALPEQLQNDIEQNLDNGRLPAPAEVKQNTVPPAPDACETFKAELPPDWFREKIQVPENPADPGGHKIGVFYYGKIHDGSVPTIFFNGGPGGDSHGSYQNLTRTQKEKDPQNKISFIFIDQRGNGCSDRYPQMPTRASAEQKEEVLQRLKYYGSTGIVADSEAVRLKLRAENKLPTDKWNVFGQSYGAFIVHRYAANSPQSVNEALAHANTLQSSPESRMQERLASQVRVMENYLLQYPGDRAKLQKLKELLPADRCYENEDKSEEICGHYILEIFNSLLGFSNHWKYLNEWLGPLVNEAGTIDEEEMSLFLASFYFSDFDPLNRKNWASSVLAWVDRNTASYSVYNCHQAKKALAAAGVDLTNALMHECMGGLQFPEPAEPPVAFASVRHLPRDLLTVERMATALRENPQLRFNIYSGQLDTFVPVANFTEQLDVIRSLPNVHYTSFSDSGHEGYRTEPQIWADLTRAAQGPAPQALP